ADPSHAEHSGLAAATPARRSLTVSNLPWPTRTRGSLTSPLREEKLHALETQRGPLPQGGGSQLRLARSQRQRRDGARLRPGQRTNQAPGTHSATLQRGSHVLERGTEWHQRPSS